MLAKDTQIFHAKHGLGQVIYDDGDRVTVQFSSKIEGVDVHDCQLFESITEKLTKGTGDDPARVVSKILAHAIRSVNDLWAVFSCSKIQLLPHQLWVCKKVLEKWPSRWLVADDVGLGKTIEAGLILMPLISSKKVRRLLILAPASLVQQWQKRLREMFDIRARVYVSSDDTEDSHYWDDSSVVIASAQTLRMGKDNDKKNINLKKNGNKRWDRILKSPPWDLVMVDEAHHMYADEKTGKTLLYQLIDEMNNKNKIVSLVLFTGTPHRGKSFGFFSLMQLLDFGKYNMLVPYEERIANLKNNMIRNNKQLVTDLLGNTLFTEVSTVTQTYSYSEQEKKAYQKISDFIMQGRAYANDLDPQRSKTVNLILTAIQKLMSSSFAAVKSAISKRVAMLRDTENKYPGIKKIREIMNEMGDEELELDDEVYNEKNVRLQEELAALPVEGYLISPFELPVLEEVMELLSVIDKESKITAIMDVVRENHPGQSVLFFTEYKATQRLLMNEIIKEYGSQSVQFINGDEYLEDVLDQNGRYKKVSVPRTAAADAFNKGNVRFLISTEAAGEGIDLQENCNTIFHVDMPWNPMRLHQRVGRINRYGQTKPVQVYVMKSDFAIEDKIWNCLENKLTHITRAFAGAMDEPEDMRKIVLGLMSPNFMKDIIEEYGQEKPTENLEKWFDSKTGEFGGKDAQEVVKMMLGDVSRFDYQNVSKDLPRLDIPDLIPFMKVVLSTAERMTRFDEEKKIMSFNTPDEIVKTVYGIQNKYDVVFDRMSKNKKEDLCGFGFKVFDHLINMAQDDTSTVACLAGLENPLIVYSVYDKITNEGGNIRSIVFGVECRNDSPVLLKDSEIIPLLGKFAEHPRSNAFKSDIKPHAHPKIEEGDTYFKNIMPELDLPFKKPASVMIACLLPG